MSRTKPPQSAFKDGLASSVESLVQEIQQLYLADRTPWIIGYSGGKDSTAVLQLIWIAVSRLSVDQRLKPVHVISTDTLVENPIVASWVTHSLECMRIAAERDAMPITPHRLTPALTDSFWVNLIGKGYPAPRPKFRWCTERLKIKPSNEFVTGIVSEYGEAILALGTRKAESSVRRANMMAHEDARANMQGWHKLSPNAKLPGCLIYTPIEDWTNDDVWLFLMQIGNPWGYNNKDLLTMYQGASPDGECPLVVDSSTPSCGDSRFGCWVCTLVDQDKSMHAMIQNDEEKEWMLPLLQIRNALDVPDDRPLRDYRRMSGLVQIFNDRPIPGPYKQSVRADWVKRVLTAQEWVRRNGPDYVRDIELISTAELNEIRRIWVVEKHEVEDVLPAIYKEVTGNDFPGGRIDDNLPFGTEELQLLRELCGSDELLYECIRELLDVERRFRMNTRRAGLFDVIEDVLGKTYYTGEADAIARAIRERDARRAAAAAQTGILDFEPQHETTNL